MTVYLCRYRIKGRLVEEDVTASSPFQAQRIVEAKFAGSDFKWATLPNPSQNCIRWMR
jgi:hypothetical protein